MANRKRDLLSLLVKIEVYYFVINGFSVICGKKLYQYYLFIPALLIIMSALICIRLEKPSFRLCKTFSLPEVLYLFPFFLIASVNLWRGISIPLSFPDVFLCCFSMLSIGIAEELLYRGFLTEYLLPKSQITAVIVSGVLFGLSHLINLSHGFSPLSVVLQVLYSTAIGIMLGAFTVKVNNLLPCCIFHGIFNLLSVFSSHVSFSLFYEAFATGFIILVSFGYTYYLMHFYKTALFGKDKKSTISNRRDGHRP